MSNVQRLPLGLYETLKTRKTQATPIPDGAVWEEMELAPDDAEHIPSLTRYLAQQVAARLEEVKPKERIALVNKLLDKLQDDLGQDAVATPGGEKSQGNLVQLIEVKSKDQKKATSRPSTPLSGVALLTNNPKEPQLGAEIKKEIGSADRVDLLCSFLKLTGVNVLAPQLEILKQRGVPFRVITTTYMGATDRKAVDKLVKEYGAEVKISYEKNSTRLHAKAWLFHRNTGFSTGYVGSSNLSHAALTDGLEWNVRVSNSVTPGILGQFTAAFESYWESPQFEAYTASDTDQAKLDVSLSQATIGTGARARPNTAINFSYVDVRPYPHQTKMLDELHTERQKGHHRNLAVAATGTGKTIFSALDYKRLCNEAGRRLRLLFVAHQAEILSQSQSTFATVMRDPSFGEQYFGGVAPEKNEQVFATVQTLAGSGLERFSPDHFDVVIIDEFHHASAPTYRKVLDYFRPKELLGLTATPERTDGKDVAAEYFDGRIATELRLWDALEGDLLVPFHYYGIDDGTDLTGLTFERGKYRDSELSRYYLAHKSRVALVLEQIQQKIAHPAGMRAIGFCVDTAHAQYMAEEFTSAGLPATYLLGTDTAERRREVITQLKDPQSDLTTVFTVNLFNEGVDIPEVDTLLMLRPTQSPTLFQQQLGRGLRRSPDKAVAIVLDFVGNQAKGFRFDLKIRALSSSIVKPSDIENFNLPPGCSIQLGKKTQEQVIASIESALRPRIEVLVGHVKVFFANLAQQDTKGCPYGAFGDFLDHRGLTPEHIYGRKYINGRPLTFTALLEKAGVIPSQPELHATGSMVAHIAHRVKALAHVNDEERAKEYSRLLTEDLSESDLTLREKRYAWMLLFSFWNKGKFSTSDEKFTLDQGLTELRRYPHLVQELIALWEYRVSRDRHFPATTQTLDVDIPLKTHAYYTREEIFAALGHHESEKQLVPGGTVRGVLQVKQTNTVALMVTLQKSEKYFTPETMHQDYAVTETEFAWDSQRTTDKNDPLGQFYQHHARQGRTPLLFVRHTKTDEIGTTPYMFVGPVSYHSHHGSKPMHIKWDLERPLPAELFALARSTA